ncbi:TonB-dependent siderophore receptor [Bradyrhizobium elkanii]|nr:TonB-dependent siderophore receptor [Bradyrhizobium elkanii]MBP2429283.1 iron complex outermembrane receptor protein [Bradyrhizobium elkanii]MCP1755292.1 iron complex outermembrane receptor protein [Bradyrhizobium elkanii]MCP1980809.1 iron complex outermembrane receptor protein [Bradyrhizobium elkanii]MCS3688960.1 iron complex outermembrane receptor protein [Bradyrhizobium elkanii]MCS3884415.1 iron complex outermembrane receptor protein [Bradyrhizobium elkanii]
MLASTAAINAAFLGSVVLVPVDADVATAQVQTIPPQNNVSELPAVTVDEPGAAKKRGAVVSSQNTRASRAVAANRRRSAAAPAQSQAPRSQGAGGAIGTTTGYVATASTAGTKTSTALIETPQSLSVVTQKELRDRNVQTLKDAVSYTPGVTTTAFGYDPRFDSFYIRGFDATYTGIYRDGLRQGGGNFAIPKIEPYGLDSVSILRGPASGLYGLGSPGGIVDVTTKRPPLTAFGEVQLQGGTYDRYQGSFDVGGPVPGSDQLYYRLTGLLRDAKTWYPGNDDDRAYIAPALTWRPDADTSFTILSEYQKSRTAASIGDFRTPDGQLTNIYSNDPAFSAMDQKQYRIGYAFEHNVDDVWTVRQNFRFYRVDVDAKYTQIDSIDGSTNLASRSAWRILDSFNTVTLDNQAEAKFMLGAIRNTALFGVDYGHSYYNDKIGYGPAPDLNLLTMNYGAQAIATPAFSIFNKQSTDEVGVYAQEQAKLGGFILTLNGRQSWVSQTTTAGLDGVPSTQKATAFTGRAGLSYVFDNGIAPYVSYATAFAPQVGVDASGLPFRPTTGEQKEVGIKYQMRQIPVLLTAAVFDITQDNVLRTDPNNMAFQAATGQVESKGVELEAKLALKPGFDLTAAYTHLNVVITQGNPDTTGNELSGIPRNSFAAFGKYTFQSGVPVEGLGLGLGVRYIGTNFGNDQNTFQNAATTLFDAVIDYDLGKLDRRFLGATMRVNATNLFDTHYQTCQSGYCYAGERRQVIGTLSYRW